MVKTFIQTIDWHHSFRLLRKTLASLLIFSLLASDIAKAMEDEEARGTISLPPLTNPSSFVLDGDVVKREPLTVTSLSQPRLRSSSLSQIETPTLPSADLTSPRQAYSADSLPRPPLHDERTLQISSPLPANSPVAFDPLDPNPQEGNLPNPLFTMTEHLVQIESPFPLVSTMVPSSVPENHPPQSPKKISPLPKPGDTDDESDEFDDGEQDNSSFIIVFESNDVDSKNVQKRKEKRSVAQRQLGSPIRPTESTHLLSHSSINGEDFDGYMAREFVMLGTSPNATDALPPETPSWWQKLKSWASGRTWLPQQPTYTLESTQTRWLQDFRPQDRGNSDEEEIIGERRVPSLHVDHSSDESDDAQLESSGSSGNGSPQNIKPAVLFDDPNPNFLPIL
ncbi:MAG: hypothetical protein K2W92_03795, partial [Alphaproteobacteria bacterium]|nr:hypothetical protein [Alphaproteobacteria bacterium]